MDSNQLLYWSLLASTAAYVFWRGGAPERLGMAAWIVNSILSAVANALGFGSYDTLLTGVFVIDLATLGAFLWLSLKADRFWPLWMTGFHLWGVLAHIAKMLAPGLHPAAYAIGQAVGGYLILTTLVVGTARHRRRVKQNGADRSWNSSSRRSAPGARPARRRS